MQFFKIGSSKQRPSFDVASDEDPDAAETSPGTPSGPSSSGMAANKVRSIRMLRLLVWILSFPSVLFVSFFYLRYEGLSLRELGSPRFLFMLGVVPLMMAALAQAPKRSRIDPVIMALLILALVMVVPFSFMQRGFGTKELSAMLLYFATLSMHEAVTLGWAYYLRTVAEHLVAIVVLALSTLMLLKRVRGYRLVVPVLAISAIGWVLPTHILTSASDSAAAMNLITPERDLVRAEIMTEPERPKNLLLIYVESLEEGFAVLPETADAMVPLMALADEGLRLRGLAQYPGLGYSIAGFVGSQCGVPLLLKAGIGHLSFDIPDYVSDSFMPNLVCLGDVLRQRGYHNTFLSGADLQSFGIRSFLRTHGYQEIVELETYIAEGYDGETSFWGVPDGVLFERVKETLRERAKAKEPFLIAVQNVATHNPDGIAGPECGPEPEPPHLPYVIDCTVRQVIDLIAEVERLGLTEDTVIAVMSDHLMMANSLDSSLAAHVPERFNLAFFLNAGPPREIVRQGSIMDVYPTLLEVLGFEVRDGKAGLGRSYLSPGPTLVEALGPLDMARGLHLNLPLSRALWGE